MSNELVLAVLWQRCAPVASHSTCTWCTTLAATVQYSFTARQPYTIAAVVWIQPNINAPAAAAFECMLSGAYYT